ncbi:MAG: DUF3617 family protein [Hyphomicrobium sp.]|mgnify:CR=1 FL=1
MTVYMLRMVQCSALALGLMGSPNCYADDAPSLPERKAGLWDMTTTMDEGKGPKVYTLKMCIDATMEATTVKSSIVEHKASCESYDIKKTDTGTAVDYVCKFNGRNVTSHTDMTGDFKSAFLVKITSKTSGNMDKMKGMPEEMAKQAAATTVVINRTITQDGKYLGENCGDLKGGEAMGPDGQKVAVQ